MFTNSIIISSYAVNNAVESLKKLKKSEDKLKKILKLKVKNNDKLENYLNTVNNISRNNVDLMDIIIKSGLKPTQERSVFKYSELFNKKLILEIEGADRKSAEVSINILHNTHSSMNNKLRQIYNTKNDNVQSNDEIIKSAMNIIKREKKEEKRYEYRINL